MSQKIFCQNVIGWRSAVYTESFGGTALVVSVAATPSDTGGETQDVMTKAGSSRSIHRQNGPKQQFLLHSCCEKTPKDT